MRSLTAPTKMLFALTFFSGFVSTFYAAWEMRPPVLIDVLMPITYAWILWWWLTVDSKRSTVKWPKTDLGFFIYVAWFAILPFHLFKSRGFRGAFGILGFIGFYLAGWLAAIILIYAVWLP